MHAPFPEPRALTRARETWFPAVVPWERDCEALRWEVRRMGLRPRQPGGSARFTAVRRSEEGRVSRRIAIISEHASPLAVLGGVDAGGQNVYVGQLAAHLARVGYGVDVFTRRDDPGLPSRRAGATACGSCTSTPGPRRSCRRRSCCRTCGRSPTRCARSSGGTAPTTSCTRTSSCRGSSPPRSSSASGIPFVVTFHALGKVRRLHQGDDDRFPDDRFAIEERVVREADHVIAECPQDEEDLIRLLRRRSGPCQR